MKKRFLMILLMLWGLILVQQQAYAVEPHPTDVSAMLSPQLLELLRAEMRELSVGVQGISLAVATAEWQLIQDTSEKIRGSYIMERNLTPAQASELEKALPDQFKLFDALFHKRAEQLGAAAAVRDAELVIFHYSRMLESCTVCHAEFAKSRFPGSSPATEKAHHH